MPGANRLEIHLILLLLKKPLACNKGLYTSDNWIFEPPLLFQPYDRSSVVFHDDEVELWPGVFQPQVQGQVAGGEGVQHLLVLIKLNNKINVSQTCLLAYMLFSPENPCHFVLLKRGLSL